MKTLTMKTLTCWYNAITDETDVYHIYVINNGNFITTFVKSERENKVLTRIPHKCRETLDKMRQKMMEISA